MSLTPHYTAEFVQSFPAVMEPGVLYVSAQYSTAGHLCPCGCGNKVVTKLSPARWRVTYDGEISLYPSVAATALPCNSHYFITRGEVDWHRRLNDRAKDRARVRDAAALVQQAAETRPSTSWLARLRLRR